MNWNDTIRQINDANRNLCERSESDEDLVKSLEKANQMIQSQNKSKTFSMSEYLDELEKDRPNKWVNGKSKRIGIVGKRVVK